jgi:Zn-finger nucleic acid-binding protein
MCGAPAASDATRCEHCGAALATMACPSCFALMFQGAKFCSHCGAAMSRAEVDTSSVELCPHCQVDMKAIVVGASNMRECPQCEGLWVDAETLKQIYEDREKQASVLGMAGPLPPEEPGNVEPVHYLHCPVCGEIMNRVNFAHCSHVIVNVCGKHGTWFDKDELRRIVEFIRSGGMDEARRREIADLESQRQALKAAQMGTSYMPADTPHYGDRHLGISLAAAVLKSLID